ncbi:hypothetical protein [Nostoc sp.]|uniref:hypothetical protein n=1 Tax=Nostoc sp. TaxID=1180 RepID=UPI002FFC256D
MQEYTNINQGNSFIRAIAKETEANFPRIKTIFKAEDLGGWDEIQAKFFDEGTIFDKIRAKKST